MMLTPEQQYAQALEQAAQGARLLLDRLDAMDQSGVLSQTAKDAMADWVKRVQLLHSAVPPKPTSLIPQENPNA